MLKEVLFMFITLLPYRGASGGFHLKTHIGCIIGTTLFFCGTVFLAKIIVIESTINGGSFHTVNYGFNQNKIVACYKPNQHYLNIKTAKGNIKLLQNEDVLPIYDKESLDEFLKRVDSFYKYKNSQIYKEKTEQIQFKFLN